MTRLLVFCQDHVNTSSDPFFVRLFVLYLKHEIKREKHSLSVSPFFERAGVGLCQRLCFKLQARSKEKEYQRADKPHKKEHCQASLLVENQKQEDHRAYGNQRQN